MDLGHQPLVAVIGRRDGTGPGRDSGDIDGSSMI
jgi:hypothetical protein